jgi:diguanylate cyclase (GGDEF)-like protein
MNTGQYHIYERLRETEYIEESRARRTVDARSVIMRKLKKKCPSMSEVTLFLKEYESIKNLETDGVIHTIDVLDEKDGMVLVLEDFPGEPLSAILKSKRFSLPEFLDFAVSLSETLDQLHRSGITHGNINPDSVRMLQSPEGPRIKFTDFAVDSLINGARAAIHNAVFIRDVLPYMSPEQTGRMNRSEDYRTDFYSLGITLYETLTGITPFRSKDPLELIHCHIARPPAYPELFVPDLPHMIQDIILKLMSKAPEERYQNVQGLLSDLVECRDRLKKDGAIEPFVLGSRDISKKFIIPQKLYGREEELSTLLSTFDEVCEGPNRVMLITGVSGIGKSALVYEIHKPIVAMQGHFIAGKYEQYKTDSPYSAIIQAFKGLLRQILSENEETIAVWRKNFKTALGPNGGVVTEIFPELEHIVGPQTPPVHIGPEESRNRFNLCFEDFVSVFVSNNHPLVLFLDDLQWADFASLNLIFNLSTSSAIRHVFFILSYRSNEVAEGHPFLEMVKEIENQGLKPRTLSLGPLSHRNIGELVEDFLKCPMESAMSLGYQIFRKTAGNPFFVNQFIKTLYDNGKIKFLPGKGWQWDDMEIASMQVTDNVVRLMADKIALLDEKTQEILKISSCIGNRFDLETLGHVLEKSLLDVLTDLKTAINEGYVKHVGDMYLYHHDRIQEAAYSLIPEKERAAYHLRIGRLLLEKTSDPRDLSNKLFYITDQLNLCTDLIVTPSERKRLLYLNMEAGRKAKSTAAFAPALKYFKTAEKLLSDGLAAPPGENTPLSIYQEIADSACLNGDYDLMDEYVEKVRKGAPPLEKIVEICSIEIRACFARQDYRRAIDKSRELLSRLGAPFPSKVGKFAVLLEYMKVKRLLKSKDDEALLSLPAMTDETQLAIAKIYFEMGISANLTDSTLYAYVVLRRFGQILTHGINPYAGLCFLGYGAFLSFAFRDIENATRFGELAMQLAERPEGRLFRFKTHVIYGTLIRHLKDNLETCKAASVTAYKLSREAGDQIYTGLALTYRDFVAFCTTAHLPTLADQIENRLSITKKSGQRPMIQLHGMILQLVRHLSSTNPDPARISGEHFDEDTVVPEWIVTGNHTGLAHYYTIRIALLYMTRRYDEAYALFGKTAVSIQAVRTLVVAQLITALECLVLLARCAQLSCVKKRAALAQVGARLRRIRTWCRFEPTKHQAWIHLIEAETAAVKGQDRKAHRLFEIAVDGFDLVPSPLFRSFALIRAWNFTTARGLARTSRLYMAEALATFEKLGAALLATHYSSLVEKNLKTVLVPTGEKRLQTEEALDLSTIMKSAQALSGEIVLDKLLKSIMTISLESAGAQRGFLVLIRDGHLMIQVEGSVEKSDITTLRSEPVEKTALLSPSVVNYAARTKTPVVLGNACMEGEYVSDPYISGNKIKSLLAAPMVSSGKLKGIIYLENNLAPSVFSPERIKVLELLASQAAISLENARLFDDVKAAESKLRHFNQELEKRVIERTAELTSAYEQIKTMAMTDPLTGLSNRRMMMDRIKQEVLRFKRSHKPFALVLADIDHFKTINDTYGHDCGDHILVSLAGIMTRSLREQDIVARWGGEEFLFLLPGTDGDGALTALEKLRVTVSESRPEFGGRIVPVTMTFGISIFDGRGNDTEHHLKQADQALYNGKKSGRNRVVLHV